MLQGDPCALGYLPVDDKAKEECKSSSRDKHVLWIDRGTLIPDGTDKALFLSRKGRTADIAVIILQNNILTRTNTVCILRSSYNLQDV
jgi:hypothetical protein